MPTERRAKHRTLHSASDSVRKPRILSLALPPPPRTRQTHGPIRSRHSTVTREPKPVPRLSHSHSLSHPRDHAAVHSLAPTLRRSHPRIRPQIDERDRVQVQDVPVLQALPQGPALVTGHLDEDDPARGGATEESESRGQHITRHWPPHHPPSLHVLASNTRGCCRTTTRH